MPMSVVAECAFLPPGELAGRILLGSWPARRLPAGGTAHPHLASYADFCTGLGVG